MTDGQRSGISGLVGTAMGTAIHSNGWSWWWLAVGVPVFTCIAAGAEYAWERWKIRRG